MEGGEKLSPEQRRAFAGWRLGSQRHLCRPEPLPYADQTFDFQTGVCVFTTCTSPLGWSGAEMVRAPKPGGMLGIVEHNPLNPATRIIVSRTQSEPSPVLSRECGMITQGVLLHPALQRGLL